MNFRHTRLEDLDDDTLTSESVDSLVDFGVLATTDLFDNLIVLLGPIISHKQSL